MSQIERKAVTAAKQEARQNERARRQAETGQSAARAHWLDSHRLFVMSSDLRENLEGGGRGEQGAGRSRYNRGKMFFLVYCFELM